MRRALLMLALGMIVSSGVSLAHARDYEEYDVKALNNLSSASGENVSRPHKYVKIPESEGSRNDPETEDWFGSLRGDYVTDIYHNYY